jgi:hypothetical protein
MTWVATINIGDDGTSGTISATFTDADSSTYTRTANIAATTQARDAFIAEAIAGRNLWRTQKTTNANFKANVESRFTQLDV